MQGNRRVGNYKGGYLKKVLEALDLEPKKAKSNEEVEQILEELGVTLEEDKGYWLRNVNAQLMYYLKWTKHYIDSLSDDDWAIAWLDLIWIRKQEKELSEKARNGNS